MLPACRTVLLPGSYWLTLFAETGINSLMKADKIHSKIHRARGGHGKARLLTWLVVVIGVPLLIGLFVILMMDYRVGRIGRRHMVSFDQVTACDCVIVPGALVYADGTPSPMLQDRLDAAIQIFKADKTDRILVSGDHGQDNYDEVNAMRNYLLEKDIPAEGIFMDHAGFDTYDTMIRARDIFCVKKAVIVTQEFHLLRALYIGDRLGMQVEGVSSDFRSYGHSVYYRLREYLARVKACLDSEVIHSAPTYLGPEIPITGSGLDTLDR